MEELLRPVVAAVENGRLLWKKHALERMLERNISRVMVKQAIGQGKIIETYPHDYPIPSMLISSLEPEPLHVVLAYDKKTTECHIITVYRPDLEHFEADLIHRKRK